MFVYYGFQSSSDVLILSCLLLKREPDHEEQPDDNMPPKFKRHLNDDEVTGSIRSERVRLHCRGGDVCGLAAVITVICSDWLSRLYSLIKTVDCNFRSPTAHFCLEE